LVSGKFPQKTKYRFGRFGESGGKQLKEGKERGGKLRINRELRFSEDHLGWLIVLSYILTFTGCGIKNTYGESVSVLFISSFHLSPFP